VRGFVSNFLRCFDFSKTTELIREANDTPPPEVRIELEAEVKRLTARRKPDQPSDLETIYRLHKHPKPRRDAILRISRRRMAKNLKTAGHAWAHFEVAPGDNVAVFTLGAGHTAHEADAAPRALIEFPVHLFFERQASPIPNGRPLSKPTVRPASPLPAATRTEPTKTNKNPSQNNRLGGILRKP
jgi:hypothetical protein